MSAIQGRASSRWPTCANNMRQIALACLNYESVHGTIPPAYIADENGKPMHSWRVLILPYLEEQNIYDQYNFNEPWNGPNNRILAKQVPPYGFQCYSTKMGDGETTYKLVTGPGTAFVGDRKFKLNSDHDGTATAIFLIEDSNNPVNWMKPEDVTIDEALDIVLDAKLRLPHSYENKFSKQIASHAALLSGSVLQINPSASGKVVRQSLDIHDGVSPDLDLIAGSHVIHKPQAYIALIMYFVLLFLPAFFLFRKPPTGNK